MKRFMKALVAGSLPAIFGAVWQSDALGGEGVPSATQPAAATAAATMQSGAAALAGAQTAAAYRTKFEKGDPLSDFFNALSRRFGVVVIVQPEAAKATAPAAMELPDKLNDAIAAGQEALDGQGMVLSESIDGDMRVLHVALKDATTQADDKEPLGIGPTTHPSLPRLPPTPPAVRRGGGRGSRG